MDAHALATLLRGELIASAHAGQIHTPAQGSVASAIVLGAAPDAHSHRIHALIDRQRELKMPQCSDLFGRKDLTALNKLVLSEPEATLLREELGLLELIQGQIKAPRSAFTA